MNAPEHNPAADELLRHAQWIRSLARALVSDDAAAEDVAQETLVAALTHPPTESKLRPWLGQVVRNFARLHHRSTGRRREREIEGRGPGELPGPEELSERLEAEQRLTRELARLDEPFRSTLMHRYYEDLEPVEIAERLGLPGGTVRWRLKRGLELLRARLDDAHNGDRRSWSLALLPLARIENAAAVGAAASSVAVPGLILMNALKIAGAAAAVCIAAVGLAVTGVLPETLVPWSLADAPLPVEFRPLELQVEPVAAAPLLEPEPAPERVAALVEIAPEPEPEPAAPAPEPMVFEARILGEGAALAGAELKVMIFDVDFGEPALSGPDGSVSISSTEFADPLPVSVEVSAPGFASVALETRGEPGVTTHLGIVDLAPGGVVSGVVLDEHGRGLANCTVTIAEDGSSKRQLEQMRFMAAHVRVPSTRTDDLGRFRLDGLPVGMVRLWGHADDYLSGYTAPIEVRAGQETFGVEFELEPRGPSNRVRGIVLDPDGEPVSEANLRYRNSSKVSRTTVAGDRRADADGRFEFLMSEDATLALTASDPDGRWSPATVANISTGGGELVLRLTEEVLLTLEVRGEDGQLVTQFGLEVFEQDGEHRLKSLPSEERPEGGAEFPRPSTAFIVRITAPGFALLELGPLDPDLLEQPDLHAVLAPLPGLRGQVLRDGAPAAGVRVSLRRQIEGARLLIRNGFRMRMEGDAIDEARTDSEGRFLLTPRASGGYYARAEPDTGAPAEFGPFEVGYDLSGPDLLLQLGEGGAIEGRVELALGADPEGAIIGITRGDGDARTLRAEADGHFRIENLMAGPWQLELREEELISGQTSSVSSDAGGNRPFDEWSCTVFDGETTYFDLREVSTESWPFTGRLTINGEPAQDWTAALVPNGTLIALDGPTASLDRNGEFALQATTSGPQRLLLRSSLGEDGEQFLIDEVLVRDGTWSHDLEVGALTVTELPRFDAEGVPLVAHFWQGRGDLWCLTMFAPDEAGEAHLTRIPAGPSRLVEPAQNFDPETWTVLRELELEPRGTQTVSLR